MLPMPQERDVKLLSLVDVLEPLSEEELRELALRSEKVTTALHGASISKVIVRPPGLVNVVPGKG